MENFAIKKIDLKFNFIFWSIGFCAFIKLKVVHAAKTEFVQFNVPCDFPPSFSYFIFVDFLFWENFEFGKNFSFSIFGRFLSCFSLNSLCRHSQFIYIFTTQHTFLHTQQAQEKKIFMYSNFPTRKKKMKMKKKWKTRKIFSNWLLQSTFVFTAIETHFRVFCEREEKFGIISNIEENFEINFMKLLEKFVKFEK